MRKLLIADEASGYFRRIELMELANPTGLIDDAWQELIAPRRQELLNLIWEIAGPETSEKAVRFCEMSIVNQCRGYIIVQKSCLEPIDEKDHTPEGVEMIAEHITRFRWQDPGRAGG